MYSNGAFPVFAKATKTATFNGDDFTNKFAHGIIFYVKTSAVAGTGPTLDIKLQSKSPSGAYIDIDGATFAQITTNTDVRMMLYPGLVEVANKEISAVLPHMWRLVYTIGGSGPTFDIEVWGEYLQ